MLLECIAVRDLGPLVKLLALQIEEECIIGKVLRTLLKNKRICLKLTSEVFNKSSKFHLFP